MTIQSGRILNKRYRLIRPLGQGSQGSVWVAEHLALTTQVAVKLIDADLAKREDARERFRREATAAAQLRSAHVVQILDHGIDNDQPFIVMEILEGEDLHQRLERRTRLSIRETSKIITHIARALVRAHGAGIVHRDLKPENVFLVSNEDDELAKVLDFGVAKVANCARTTMQRTGIGILIGTPHYMSPEQVKGIGEVDHLTDIWALGVIAFQCLTGQLPFDSDGIGDLLIQISTGEMPIPSKVYSGIPTGFDAWFAMACSRDSAQRFQTAKLAAQSLAKLIPADQRRLMSAPPPSEEGGQISSSVSASRNEVDETDVVFDDFDEPPLPIEKKAKDVAQRMLPANVNYIHMPSPRVRLRSSTSTDAPITSTVRPATVGGLSSRPPPEIDGLRRKRLVGMTGVILGVAAALFGLFVYNSQREPVAATPVPIGTSLQEMLQTPVDPVSTSTQSSTSLTTSGSSLPNKSLQTKPKGKKPKTTKP